MTIGRFTYRLSPVTETNTSLNQNLNPGLLRAPGLHLEMPQGKERGLPGWEDPCSILSKPSRRGSGKTQRSSDQENGSGTGHEGEALTLERERERG